MDSQYRDGGLSFAHYSLEQLQELQYSIDPQAFPLNAANLSAELARRQATEGRAVDPRAVAQPVDSVQFTSAEGWLGWLQARRRGALLYGNGSIEIRDSEVVLYGWRRTWLAAPQRTVVAVPAAEIQNAAASDLHVRFEWKRRHRRARLIEFEAATSARAAAVVDRLPGTQTPGFANYWPEIRDFTRQLDLVSPHAWSTPILVLINLIVFGCMAVAARSPGAFDLPFLWNWGANFGVMTLHGQQWRLLTALFLHANLAHVLLNMWVLWNAGRLTERLYGTWSFLFVYLAAGALGNLTSTLWSVDRTTVGASAAVFGVFGAFLAYLVQQRTRVPHRLARAHWLSTIAFLLYNLISGALQSNIDNAAHLGGLCGGLALGWMLARPLDGDERREFPFRQTLGAVMLVVVALLLASWLTGSVAQPTAVQQFLAQRPWYVRGEAENLRRWSELEVQRGTRSISTDTFATRVRSEIVPFWKMAAERLRKELPSVPDAQRPFATLLADFARERFDWATELGESSDDSQGNDIYVRRFAELATMTAARAQRLGLRAIMDRQAASWSGASAVIAARELFMGRSWSCVESPYASAGRPAPSDSLRDGPALRHAAGCRAQQLFLSGQYRALDASLSDASTRVNDLPDGSSTLGSYYVGLNNLFEFGGYDIEKLLLRTAQWRRAVPGSVAPDLVEADIFSDWAWNARGHGYAKEVSGIAWDQFRYRLEMAVATLEEVAQRAASNPMFYQLSLSVGLDSAVDRADLRAIFDRGAQRFRSYGPLYRAMLRALMPRWGGSYDQVDQLITSAARLNDPRRDLALYARLYWTYSSLEDDQIDIFTDGKADWSTMKDGFRALTRIYPDSDYILNGFAKFACMANDRAQYAQLRPLLAQRMSSQAWSQNVKLDSCDTKLLRADQH